MLSIYLALIDEPSDKEKFEQLYHDYQKLMLSTAMSVLHNTALAEEAVQESFLKIAKNISAFSSEDCNKTVGLIVIIVRNTPIDILRKERLEASLSYDDKILADSSAPDVANILNGEISEVLEIISSLDNSFCDVLTLKYVYGYRNTEIAKLLGITEQNAAVRLYRAKNALKIKLEEKGYEFK